MRRAFDVDVLVCPRCGGRLRLLGTIEDPVAIRAILDSLAASAEPVDRAPPATTLKPATLNSGLTDRPPAGACVVACSEWRQRAPRVSPKIR
jgi:hypothetical protein